MEKRERRGGKRFNGGRKPLGTSARDFMRSIVDDPERRAQFLQRLADALNGDDPMIAINAYLRVFEHGYGRPPQSLEVNAKVENASYVMQWPAADGSTADTTAAAELSN